MNVPLSYEYMVDMKMTQGISMDKVVNASGVLLMHVTSCLSIIVLYRRLGMYKGIGALTCDIPRRRRKCF